VLLAAGASLAAPAATTHCAGMGTQPLLFTALRRRHYSVAGALLQRGAPAAQPGPALQPLHALALGLGQGGTLPAQPSEALSAARLLIRGGAGVDAASTGPAGSTAGLSQATPLLYLCGAATQVGPSAELALFSLVDMLLLEGADPNARDVWVRAGAGERARSCSALRRCPAPPARPLLSLRQPPSTQP
jgi:hypothetical protein